MKKAFTLIELLVVIAIIAILSGVVMSQFSVARARSRDAKRIADIAQMQLAIQLYFDRCNQYPDATSAGALNLSSTKGCPQGISVGTFLNQLPTPSSYPTGTEYTYRYVVHTTNSINDDYYIYTTLETNNVALNDDVDNSITLSSGGWTPSTGTANFGTADANDTVYAVRAK